MAMDRVAKDEARLYGPAARCKPKVMIWKVGLAHLYPAY
jgi:hypothetical protein